MDLKSKKILNSAFYFGIMSSIMTIIPFILGIYNDPNITKKLIIISICSMSISDALADGYGIYLADDINTHPRQTILMAGLITVFVKILLLITYILPFIYFSNIKVAVYVSLIWGVIILFFISYLMSKDNHKNYLKTFINIGGFTTIIIIICVSITKYISKSS